MISSSGTTDDWRCSISISCSNMGAILRQTVAGTDSVPEKILLDMLIE
jgi:hypothetical protein